jgi:hypothetical protein
MIIYYATDYKAVKVYSDLQSQRTSNSNPANFLSCPAVRDSWHNVFMFSPKQTSEVTYARDLVLRTKDLPISQLRKPHLIKTNIFNLDSPSYFFCKEPLQIKVTAPYFHNVDYQAKGTFIGGIFDIGRWFRPIQSEIITWDEIGEITFTEGQPLFYVEFLTDSPVILKQFRINPIIETLASALVNSPYQNTDNMQGSLESRYQAFETSEFREGLLNEIKDALVSKDEASPTV